MAPARWLLLPAALSVVAVLPLPYGYYTFLRLTVSVAAALVAYAAYRKRGTMGWEVVVCGVVALLFNPLLPVHLTREIWAPINLAVAALLTYLALRPASPVSRQDGDSGAT